MSIPASGFNVQDLLPLTMKEGTDELRRNVPRDMMQKTIAGMLFRIAAVDLPMAFDEDERLRLHARSIELNNLMAMLTVEMSMEEIEKET